MASTREVLEAYWTSHDPKYVAEDAVFTMRWELENVDGGTRLTLWTNIDRRFMAMGAAGWHLCFDVLDNLLSGEPIGRIVGPDALKVEGWQRLHSQYAKQFAGETSTRG